MLKNNNGITLISLAITLIVLLILAGVTIDTSVNLIKDSKIRNYITSMSLIKIEVEKNFEDFEFENDVSNLNNISELAESEIQKLTIENTAIKNNHGACKSF